MTHQYSLYIVWSKEDDAYLAKVSELPGCMADGATPEAALANVQQVISEWVEVASEEKRKIPPPMTLEDYETVQVKFKRTIEEHIRREVQEAVQRIIGSITEHDEYPMFSRRSKSISLPKTRKQVVR